MNAKSARNLFGFVLLIVLLIGGAVALIETTRREPAGEPQPAARIANVGRSADDPFPRRLADASGREIVIRERPRRIASQTVGTDEMLLAICAPERIARLSPLAFDERYSNVVDEARASGVPAAMNAEEILAADPDLIFVASFSRAETVETLAVAGAPVFRLGAFNTFDDIRSNIRDVGYLIGEDARAADLVRRMDAELDAITRRIRDSNREGAKPRIMSYGGNSSAGAGTLFDEIARAAGAINVTAEKGFDGFPHIGGETIAGWNPDYIIGSALPRERDAVRRRLLSDPAIRTTEAGKRERIIVIDTRALLAVSHHITRAVDELARGLYGRAG